MLDWSGRKPLDYRKQSTSVSASTYSSKYGSAKSLIGYGYTTVSSMPFIPSDVHAFGTMKLKRHKRFSTTTGVLNRTQSMLGYLKSPDGHYDAPNRNTHFSPELDHGKRNQKRYRSILFRKKANYDDKTKDGSADNNNASCT